MRAQPGWSWTNGSGELHLETGRLLPGGGELAGQLDCLLLVEVPLPADLLQLRLSHLALVLLLSSSRPQLSDEFLLLLQYFPGLGSVLRQLPLTLDLLRFAPVQAALQLQYFPPQNLLGLLQ